MPLPILETPTYELTIPSTKMNVEYRPFLVKEEKMLLVAQESKNQKEMLRAMKKLVDVCLFKKVDVDKLALFDLEYIFIKLRSKSVGETTTILAPCGKCEESTEITINLDEIIESIFDADNVYPAIDQTPRELDAFVDSLSHQQIQKITDFIDQSPKLTDKIQFTCTACKHVNKNTLEGSDAFF